MASVPTQMKPTSSSLPWPVYSSLSPRSHCNWGRVTHSNIKGTTGYSCDPPHLSTQRIKLSTSSAGIIYIQRGAAELPNMAVAWLRGQLYTTQKPDVSLKWKRKYRHFSVFFWTKFQSYTSILLHMDMWVTHVSVCLRELLVLKYNCFPLYLPPNKALLSPPQTTFFLRWIRRVGNGRKKERSG